MSSARLRVLIVPSWYPTPERPVVGSFVREQADALSAVHDVRILHPHVLPRGERRPPETRIVRDRGYPEETVEVTNRFALWPLAYLRAYRRALRRVWSDFRPDLVHAHVAVPAGWAAVAAGAKARLPVVLTEHMDGLEGWTSRPHLRRMARRAYAGADVVIPVGPGQRDRIRSAFAIAGRVVTVPNSIDGGRFRPTPYPAAGAGFRLAFVGLMDSHRKGLPVVLEALRRIAADGALEVRLDVVGDGELRPHYEAEAARLGLAETVTFHGLVSGERVAEILGQAHALVLPSAREAAPVVVAEALASGRPVVGSRCGGTEHMLDPTQGVLVEPGDPAALAAALVDVLTHLDRYDPERLAAAAQARFGRDAVVEALTDVYRSLLPGR